MLIGSVYSMCEHDHVILSTVIDLLTTVVLLALCIISTKKCLMRRFDQFNLVALPGKKFVQVIQSTVQSCETPLSVKRQKFQSLAYSLQKNPIASKFESPSDSNSSCKGSLDVISFVLHLSRMSDCRKRYFIHKCHLLTAFMYKIT